MRVVGEIINLVIYFPPFLKCRRQKILKRFIFILRTITKDFVNAYRAKNPYYQKKDIVKKAGVLWSEIKGDAGKIADYIASAPKRKVDKKQSILKFASNKNIGNNLSSSAESAEQNDFSSKIDKSIPQTTTYPNSSVIIQNENVFHESVITKKVYDFISFVMKNTEDQSLATKFLTDESIWKEDVFSSTCESAAKEWGIFNDLRYKYEDRSSRARESGLSEKLENIEEFERHLKAQMTDILAINTSSTLGLDCLVRNASTKKEAVLEITGSLLTLQSKVTEKELIYGLRRRLRQIAGKKEYLPATKEPVKLICRNDCSLTWSVALDILIEIENGNSFGDKRDHWKHLTVSELITVANLLKDSSAVSESELLFYIPPRLVKVVDSVLGQLCTHLPVFVMRKEKQRYVINMFQLGFDCDELNSIFDIKQEKESLPEPMEQDELWKGKGRGGGRKSVLSKFPNIPDVATEFIKASGFKAQDRRRETTIKSCGVSVNDVRDHLLKVIPGLSEHGLSVNTVRYLFKPVKKGTFSAERSSISHRRQSSQKGQFRS